MMETLIKEQKTLVMKFGGASLSTMEYVRLAAQKVKARKSEYNHIVVVASAMGEATDDLLKLAHSMSEHPPKRELDMLISAGERISISLFAMALFEYGVKAISLTGSQSGIMTSSDHSNALICDVKPIRIPHLLNSGHVVVVAGFQGVSSEKEITTLGRGGSDTTAVALAIALGADKVEFYKDVDGCYDDDPKISKSATLIPRLSYEHALSIFKTTGRSVIHPRAIALAEKNSIPLHILSYKKENLHQMTKGSWIIGKDKRPLSKALFESEEM